MDIYTDGACTNNGKPNAFAGYGVFFPTKQEWNISRKLVRVSVITNNTAEMYALYSCLKKLYWRDVVGVVNIYTDSKTVISGFKYINGRMIRKSCNAPNYELWLKIYKAYDVVSEKCTINILKCSAHTGIKDGNYYADQLAVKGKMSH